MEKRKTDLDLLYLIKSNFKIFVIIGVISIVFSTVFSLPYFIPPQYESEAVLYPSNLNHYSQESATEQMLQLFEGNDLRDSVITKFNLLVHYKIDSTSKDYLYYLHKEYGKNISINKNNFEAVVVKVMDTNPAIARDIVVELIDQLNIKVRRLHREKYEEIVIILKSQLENKVALIDTLETQIRGYGSKYNLLDYVQQSREVTAGYINMLLENKKGESLQKVERLYDNIKTEGRHFQDLQHQLSLAREEYSNLLKDYDNAVKDANKKLTYTNVVVYPEIANKKSYPIRWLIVVSSLLVSFVFTLVVILFINRIKVIH